jgi:hypothetical protein
VDVRKRDAEMKLLLGCTTAEKHMICNFHQSAETAALLVERSTGASPATEPTARLQGPA